MALIQRLGLGEPLPCLIVQIPVNNVIPAVLVDINLTKEVTGLNGNTFPPICL